MIAILASPFLGILLQTKALSPSPLTSTTFQPASKSAIHCRTDFIRISPSHFGLPDQPFNPLNIRGSSCSKHSLSITIVQRVSHTLHSSNKQLQVIKLLSALFGHKQV